MKHSFSSVKDAYDFMRNPSKCSLAVRLECHQVMLREPQPINKDRMVAEAVADICEALQLLLGDRGE